MVSEQPKEPRKLLRWMNIKELSDYVKIPVPTLYKLVLQCKIPASRIGRLWRFHKDAIDDWMEGKQE